jgi:hypothetical protein
MFECPGCVQRQGTCGCKGRGTITSTLEVPCCCFWLFFASERKKRRKRKTVTKAQSRHIMRIFF